MFFQSIFISSDPWTPECLGWGSLGPTKLTASALDQWRFPESPHPPTKPTPHPIQERTSKGLITGLAQPATELTVFGLVFILRLWHRRPPGRSSQKTQGGKRFSSSQVSGSDLERGMGDVRNRVPSFISLTAHYHGNSTVLTSALQPHLWKKNRENESGLSHSLSLQLRY